MKIISIDPGYERVGVAIIEKNSSAEKEKLIHSECIRTSPKSPDAERLAAIGTEIAVIIKKHKPDAMAIETLFFTKNQTTGILVAEARGVIIYEAAKLGLEIKEYGPKQIKMAITGHGSSDKKAVMNMLPHLIKIETAEKKLDDEYDAIAVGVTCFAIERFW